MSSDDFYPEESPRRKVRVDPFWMDRTPVTNRQLAEFIEATGYTAFSEIAPDPRDYPGMDPALAQPGGMVFRRTEGPVPLHDFSNWWEFALGADWRHPWGAESTIEDKMDHPVVQMAYTNALAYAK